MNITFVTDKYEREEYKRVVKAYCDLMDRKITREEFDKLPRKEWIDLQGGEFVVVDNREGECFEEAFETLDGAILYATDVYMTSDHQEDWDYMGALKDGGDLTERVPQ